MRVASVLIVAMFTGSAVATLPPPTEEAKALAAAAAARSAWSNKVAEYQLCRAMDRVVDHYRGNLKAAQKDVPPQPASVPCLDPGPYVATQAAAKPLEAAGAHSPPGTATSPPSTKATAAEIAGGVKK